MIRAPINPLLRAASRCVVRCSASSLRTLQPQSHTFTSRLNPNPKPPLEPAPKPEPEDQAPEYTATSLFKSNDPFDAFKDSLKISDFKPQYTFLVGQHVVFYGFIGKRRDQGANLSFCHFKTSHYDPDLQIVSSWEEENSRAHTAHLSLKSVPAYSPVCVHGIIRPRKAVTTMPHLRRSENDEPDAAYDIRLTAIQCLNAFPKDIVVSKDAVWPLKSRHLQMRFDPFLIERLRLRSEVAAVLRQELSNARHFIEVETPILFKSTPEGAREFLVPTRRKGLAYALPQSPQQYKQILMAGGVRRYFQFAKCFRDEDHRADRQPEFTQLDIEMAFANGRDVRTIVCCLLRSVSHFLYDQVLQNKFNAIRSVGWGLPILEKNPAKISYRQAMVQFGTDKPDLRMKAPHVSTILHVKGHISPFFKTTISNIQNPIVEACKFRFECPPEESAKFIKEFFDTLPNTPHKSSDRNSTPGVLIFDETKPLQGLLPLGQQAAGSLATFNNRNWARCVHGDVMIFYAREDKQITGAVTELGRLRKLIYDAAVDRGLLPQDDSFNFIWVTDFPLFSPNEDDPGQGGSAGFSATHHPFTSPLSPEDLDLCKTDPLRALSDTYDLVLNGVEIGGGSRRIHVAEVQEYIMRDVLKMTDEGVGQFSHLLEALRAGCPPHAGFAFGFDRFMSIICGVPSVRDVIAFPKNNKGADQLVGSPSKITEAQKKTYHLFTEPESDTAAPA